MQHLGILLFSLLGVMVVVVWWHALLKLWSKQPFLEYRERSAAGWNPFAFTLAAFWVVMSLNNRFGRPSGAEKPPDIQAQTFLSLAVLLLLLTILAMTKGHSLADFGIRFSRIREQVTNGVIGFLASVAPVMLVLLALDEFELRKKETQHPFLKLLENEPGWTTILWIGFAAVVVAPVVEELLFRVILQGSLIRLMKPAGAIGVVAVVFSCVHGWPNLLPLFPLAVILGYVYHQRHSYLAVVVLHALFNAMNLMAVLLFKSS